MSSANRKDNGNNSGESLPGAEVPSIENSLLQKPAGKRLSSAMDEDKQASDKDSSLPAVKLRDVDLLELADDEDEHTGGELSQDAEPGKYLFRLLSIHCGKGKGGRKVYKCDICPGIYRHAFSLKRHYLRTHINYDYLSEADISNCNITMQGGARKPVVESDGSDPAVMTGLFKCQTCGQLFDDKHELKHHLANHPSQTNDKRFPCNQCEMTFSHRQNLVRHLSVHSGEKPYPCRYCGKRFPTATNQKRHERIHEGVKPYECRQCGSVFTQSGDLKKHIRKQHQQFFHPCAFCVKYFGDEGQLMKHLASHGETLESNKQAWVKRNANAAKLAATKKALGGGKRNAKSQNHSMDNGSVLPTVLPSADQKWKCKTCSKKFSSYLTLRRHQQTIHSSKNGSPRIAPITQPLTRYQFNENVPQRDLPLTEADFYADIAYNISDNLLNHLDGKICEPLKARILSEHLDCEKEATRRNLHRDWTSYNFPPGFDLQSAGALDDGTTRNGTASDSEEVFDLSKPKSDGSVQPANSSTPVIQVESVTLSHSDMLYSLALSPVHSCSSGEFTSVDGALDLSLPCRERRPSSSDTPLSIEVPRTFVCFACGESVTSFEDMEDHKLNNHPNVYCTHLEIEGTKELPLQLFKQRCSPVGVLHNCLVPPTISSVESLVCTKCDQHFTSVTDLHCHMLECGGHNDNPSSLTKRNRRRRMVKRGMKRNLEETPQKKVLSVKKPKRDTPDKNSQSSSGRSSVASKPSTPLSQSPAYFCPNCQQGFSQQSAFDRHSKKCLPKSPTVVSKAALPAKKVDTRQQLSCPYCARTFTYLASLKKHMTDCVSRKEKQRKSPGKSVSPRGKEKKRKNSVARSLIEGSDDPESIPEQEPEAAVENEPEPDPGPEIAPKFDSQPESEVDEETSNSDFSSSSKAEAMETCEEALQEVVSHIKQEASVEEEIMKEVEDESDSSKLQSIDVKLEDEKKGIEGHCHSCPHCRRTYTYLANFKKHVSEACPLRKDLPKNSGIEESGLEEEGAAKETVVIDDGSDDEHDDGKEEVEVEEDSKPGDESEDSCGSAEGKGESPMKSEAESAEKEDEKTDKEHLRCPICDRVFVSYVKLLQHKLSHKMKPEEKEPDDDGESETKLLCPHCERVFETVAVLKRHKPRCNGRRAHRKRKAAIVPSTPAKTSPGKHRGGWPKGKSRKGYIPKHKRVAVSEVDDAGSGANKVKVETEAIPQQKLDQSKENDSGDAAETTEDSPASQPAQGKAPLEEQPGHNNVILRSSAILRRVRQKRNGTLLATKVQTPDPPPPTAVAS